MCLDLCRQAYNQKNNINLIICSVISEMIFVICLTEWLMQWYGGGGGGGGGGSAWSFNHITLLVHIWHIICVYILQATKMDNMARLSSAQCTKVFIQRDFSDGTAVRFQNKFPQELEGKVLIFISLHVMLKWFEAFYFNIV